MRVFTFHNSVRSAFWISREQDHAHIIFSLLGCQPLLSSSPRCSKFSFCFRRVYKLTMLNVPLHWQQWHHRHKNLHWQGQNRVHLWGQNANSTQQWCPSQAQMTHPRSAWRRELTPLSWWRLWHNSHAAMTPLPRPSHTAVMPLPCCEAAAITPLQRRVDALLRRQRRPSHAPTTQRSSGDASG